MSKDDAATVATRIDELLEQFERAGDTVARQRAEELVRTIIEFYGEGLGRIVDILHEKEGTVGGELHQEFAADSLVGSLLALHDLHPTTTEQRVSEALDTVRPYLGSHAGDVELVGIDEDAILHLRLQGNCDGCPSSTVTVKLAIENAIRQAAPELAGIEVEGVVEPTMETGTGPGGRPLLPVLPEQARAIEAVDSWVDVAGLDGLASGELMTTVVENETVVVCNVDGNLYAYANRCPRCTGTLASSRLLGGLLHCASCGEAYEVQRAGRGERHPELHLSPLPLLSDNGSVRIALAAGAAL